jgi:hypothetical protein
VHVEKFFARYLGGLIRDRQGMPARLMKGLLAIKIEMRKTMHDPIARTGAWMKRILQGHLNYFAVPGNHPSLWWFFNKVRRLWLMSLRRRSQKARLSWEKFIRLVARFFPPIRTLHPWPGHRFDAKPEGGARCVSSARRDLRGGRGAILVPCTLRIAWRMNRSCRQRGERRVSFVPWRMSLCGRLGPVFQALLFRLDGISGRA